MRSVTFSSTRSTTTSGDAIGNGMSTTTIFAPVSVGDVVERVAAGVVLVRRHQQLVELVEVERAQDGVHARRRIRHEREPLGIGADELRQRRARVVEQRLELAHEEAHRLALHLRAILVLLLEHDARRRAERAVVEEGDVRDRASSAVSCCDDIASSMPSVEDLFVRQQRHHEIAVGVEVEEVSRLHDDAAIEQRQRELFVRSSRAARGSPPTIRLRPGAPARTASNVRAQRREVRARALRDRLADARRDAQQLRQRDLHRRGDGEEVVGDQLQRIERLALCPDRSRGSSRA